MGAFSSFCSVVYANPHVHRHMRLWNDLIRVSNIIQGPWIVLGDFNDILMQNEVRGGSFYNARSEKFAETLAECNLFDMGLLGEILLGFERRKRNKIHGLFLEDGTWSSEATVLESETNSFFQKFFSTREAVNLDAMGEFSCPSLSREACQKLVEPVALEEVKRAVFGMNSFKALGPDGFQALFYKEFWESLSSDVWGLVKKAFAGENISAAVFDTFIVLIPKVEAPSYLKDFRPISLCNVIYKIITKVLVNRFRPFLSEIIGPLQGGFIPRRGTTENIIIAQEIMHFMRKTKSKKGSMAFKIDLEKAYDRVDWRFLETSLIKFGFPVATINLIMACVTSSSLSILWNGNRLQSFKPIRGLRQGDPMSPYLFVLCMENLSCLISHKVSQGSWIAVSVSRHGPKISHLMFADDLLLFCKATKTQVTEVMKTLDMFTQASGLKVNIHKSKAQCSKNVSARRKEVLSGIFSIRFCQYLGRYLGVNIGHDRASRKMAQEVIDKIQRKLASWKGCLLNKAARLCLVNAVMASIPVYNMQVSLLPKYACDKIDSLMRQFLWKGQANGRGLPLVKWDIAITSKKAGGLGVRDTLCANMALLGKLVWDCLNNKNKLWVQVLTHKYLQNSKDLGSNHCHNASTTWRNILKAYDILKEGFRWNVGNMQQSIWYDEWSPLGKLCELTSYVHISETNFSLADLWSNGTWEGDKLVTPISHEVKQFLHSLGPPLMSESEPGWIWWPTSIKAYSSREGYRWLLTKKVNSIENSNCGLIWCLNLPEKIKMMMWLGLQNALPTNAFRFKRHLTDSDRCSRCNADLETMEHCLRDCEKSRCIWQMLDPLLIDSFEGTPLEFWIRKVVAMARITANDLRKSASTKCITFKDRRRWKPPTGDTFKVNCDASLFSDWNLAGIGCVIRDSNGRWISDCSSSYPPGPIVRCELFAVWRGLILAWDYGLRDIVCETDSLDILHIFKNPANGLNCDVVDILQKIQELLSRPWVVDFEWITHDANAVADWLARYAVKTNPTHVIWSEPCDELQHLMLVDLG
nr:uncharacterized protein LOC112794781 [Arachis hypogaea]